MKNVVYRDDYPVVSTVEGLLHGIEIDGVQTFRGVPYAAAERFCRPKPFPAWEGVREAAVWGNTAPVDNFPQSSLFGMHTIWPTGEDCQNLNVWTNGTAGKKPVMVWLHGGGFSGGSSIDEAVTLGDELARTGKAVVVSINHRLNLLGYMDLSDQPGFEDSVNLGMYDIIAALEWVQRNIAAFGGDPDNVTLFGQSGGGGKITALMQMPEADGLYHKAIVQSGIMPLTLPPENKKAFAAKMIEKVGAEGLRTLPYTELVVHAKRAAEDAGLPLFAAFEPAKNGEKLKNDYTGGFRSETAKVPMMVGSCIGELSLFDMFGLKKPQFSAADVASNDDAMKLERLQAKYGEKAARVMETWREAYPEKDPLYALYLDTSLRNRVVDFSRRRFADADAPVYQYLLSYTVPVGEGKLAWHGGDLGFTFGTIERHEVLCSGGEAAFGLMAQMRDAWLAFAAAGDPNHAGLPTWKPFRPEDPACMVFDTPSACKSGHDAALMEVITDGIVDTSR